MPSRVSVVVPARDAAPHLERCLRSVLSQDPPAFEIIVVDDASDDDTSAIAQSMGCRVVRLPYWGRCGAARNAGVEIASGDVVAFLDADDEAAPGWAGAYAAAADEGADMMAGSFATPPPRTIVERYAQYALRGPDLEARGGFLPAAGGGGMALRRRVFDQLGGFDPLLQSAEDTDLSFRAGLRGIPIVSVPGAVVVRHHRQRLDALLRQQYLRARELPRFAWKYQRYPLMGVGRRHRPAPRLAGIARRLFARSATGVSSIQHRVAFAWLAFLAVLAVRAGRLHGRVELLLGRPCPPRPLRPRDAKEAKTATPLPDGPCLLLVCDSEVDLTLIARAFRSSTDIAIAPPTPTVESVDGWSDAPPWSLRLARDARARGWEVPVEATARRVEWERPRTWGEAFLALHAAHAWVGGRTRFAIAAAGPSGPVLAELLPDVSIVDLGTVRRLPRRPAVSVGTEMHTDEATLVDTVARVLGSEPVEWLTPLLRAPRAVRGFVARHVV